MYLSVYTFQSASQVNAFINSIPEKTFEEFCVESVKYVELAREIPSKLEGTIVIGMFRMQRADLITSLRSAATRLSNTLLRRMTEDYQNTIKALVVSISSFYQYWSRFVKLVFFLRMVSRGLLVMSFCFSH